MKYDFQQFIRSLSEELRGPLPGREAQHRMAPEPRGKPWKGSYDKPTPDARRGGVLMLFYPHNDEIHLPLILRPTYDGVHSGQVALPGGGYEETDANLTATALRETHEEIGVPAAQVQVIGKLSELYIFASNFLVQPTVGWTDTRPAFKADPHEVAALVETPIRTLQSPDNHFREQWQLRDRKALVPYYKVKEQTVWGATAMMLSELLALRTFSQLA